MSRFSKTEAEKAGWAFYHDAEEVVLRDGDNELGISKKVPASVRAEKFIDLPGQDLFRTTEEAPTMGKLLERIHSFEQHFEARLSAPDPEADPRVADDSYPLRDGQSGKTVKGERKPGLSFEEKQEKKQEAENERVLAAASAEGLSPGDPGAEDEDLESLPVSELKSIAKSLEVSTRGKKAALVARIKAAKK